MNQIELNKKSISDAIAEMQLLKSKLNENCLRKANGNGSGDVAEILEIMSQAVSGTKAAMSSLFQGTEEFLQDYLETMTSADEYVAESITKR